MMYRPRFYTELHEDLTTYGELIEKLTACRDDMQAELNRRKAAQQPPATQPAPPTTPPAPAPAPAPTSANPTPVTPPTPATPAQQTPAQPAATPTSGQDDSITVGEMVDKVKRLQNTGRLLGYQYSKKDKKLVAAVRPAYPGKRGIYIRDPDNKNIFWPNQTEPFESDAVSSEVYTINPLGSTQIGLDWRIKPAKIDKDGNITEVGEIYRSATGESYTEEIDPLFKYFN